jgi:Pregnancy-associated plasma protein-A/Secretion system C-terminal sorting domain
MAGLALPQLSTWAQPLCQSAAYRTELVGHNPALAARINAIEAFTQNQQQPTPSAASPQALPKVPTPDVITIPVVVHVLFHAQPQNISDEQIRSQIDVLNQDFRRTNPDTINTPAIFRPVAADCGFQFQLARADAHGYASSGIVRRYTQVSAFGINDDIKRSSAGGDDAWDPEKYLNIWVGNLVDGILGYASVVGGPKEVDGIAVLYSAFGTVGAVSAPFNRGRTATHELGHWLNLIHTWGDAPCGDDHVEDTPWQEAADRGCPGAVAKTCGPGPYGDMYMNFMDFTNDDCMNLFTQGQKARMRTLFAPGGLRSSMLSNQVLTEMPKADTISLAPFGELPFTSLYLYPNPATNLLVIQVSVISPQGVGLEIYDALGQKKLTLVLHQTLQQVNVSSLAKGVYYIKTLNSKVGQVARFVKL